MRESKTRGDTTLQRLDRALLGAPLPGEAAPPAARQRRTAPAWESERLNQAIRGFRDRQAGLVEEATTLLSAPPGPVTEGDLRARVQRGLWVAWVRYLAAGDEKAAWQAATAFGIFFDKWRLTHGLPTAITEERRLERLELLATIAHVLEARGRPVLPPADPPTPDARPV